MLIEYIFTLFVTNNAQKSFHRAKRAACLVLYSRKLFLITLLLLNPSHFVDGIRTSYGIILTITKLIDFYSQSCFTFLFATFSIEMNQNVNS